LSGPNGAGASSLPALSPDVEVSVESSLPPQARRGRKERKAR
jgi:hypothetical protein